MSSPLPVPLTTASLTENEESLLYAREAEVEAIVENCRRGRFTVVTGEPGLGVSSLLRAGAVPALQRAGFLTILYADWHGRSFARRLKASIAAANRYAGGELAAEPALPLWELLSRVAAQAQVRQPIAILLDQFEDYLRWHSDTDLASAFDAELAKAINDRTVRFVIGLQTAAVPSFERLHPSIPNLLGFRISLPPLPVEPAKDMIRDAASQEGIATEPEVVNGIVASPPVLTTGGVHPLFAKLAAALLFSAEFAQRSNLARATTLAANGGVERLVLEALDPIIQEFRGPQQKLLSRWIPLLVASGNRRLSPAEQVLVSPSGKRNRLAADLLSTLLNIGLLRAIKGSETTHYELARESAAIILHDWCTRTEASAVTRRKILLPLQFILIAAAVIGLTYIVVCLVMAAKYR